MNIMTYKQSKALRNMVEVRVNCLIILLAVSLLLTVATGVII